MNELKVFDNPEFGEVRTVEVNGKPYFVASDVARSLGYKRPNDAVSAHCKGTLKRRIGVQTGVKADGSPAIQEIEMLVIPEGDIYRLVIKSQLPTAEKFESWIFDELLPKIRKHGIYATDNVIDNILNNPDFGIELLTKLKEERAARVKAEQRNAVLMHVNKTYTMTEIAKELGLRSAIELNKILSEMHIQYKVNSTGVMYSDYSNLGYEEIKQEVLDNGAVVYHRRITQTGREFIINLVSKSA